MSATSRLREGSAQLQTSDYIMLAVTMACVVAAWVNPFFPAQIALMLTIVVIGMAVALRFFVRDIQRHIAVAIVAFAVCSAPYGLFGIVPGLWILGLTLSRRHYSS